MNNRSFLALWWGQGVSQVGSQISLVALPLAAVITLNGGPLEVATVTGTQYLPSLLFGLLAGVLVDGMDQRRIMLVTDLLRALVLLSVPAALLVGALSFPLLYVVSFLLGGLTLFFDLAYQSALPRIVVERDRLLAANGRLETTRTIAAAVGPSAGAVLVQTISAPLAVLADTASYLFSALMTLRIRLAPTDRAAGARTVSGLRTDLVAGLERVRSDPQQRAIIGVAATSNVATVVAVSLLPLWLKDGLGLPTWSLGVVLSCGAIGGVAAGFALGRLPSGTTPMRVVTVGLTITAIGSALVALAFGPAALRLGMACLGEIIVQASITVIAATIMSWRQTVTPQHLLARVISVARSVNFGVLPLASVAGGALASAIGMRPVLLIGAFVVLAAPLWLVGVPRVEAEART